MFGLERSRFGGFSGRVVIVGSGGPRLGVGNRGCVLMPVKDRRPKRRALRLLTGWWFPSTRPGAVSVWWLLSKGGLWFV